MDQSTSGGKLDMTKLDGVLAVDGSIDPKLPDYQPQVKACICKRQRTGLWRSF